MPAYLNDYTIAQAPLNGPPPYAFGFDNADLARVANGDIDWASIDANGCLVLEMDHGHTYARFEVHGDGTDDQAAYVVRAFPAPTAEEIQRAFANWAPWLGLGSGSGVRLTGSTSPLASSDTVPPEAQLLLDAIDTITGERLDSYGKAEDSFQVIADFWTTYWDARNTDMFTAKDVAHMMVLMKTAREIHAPKRDNQVDVAGYVALAQRITEKGQG